MGTRLSSAIMSLSQAHYALLNVAPSNLLWDLTDDVSDQSFDFDLLFDESNGCLTLEEMSSCPSPGARHLRGSPKRDDSKASDRREGLGPNLIPQRATRATSIQPPSSSSAPQLTTSTTAT